MAKMAKRLGEMRFVLDDNRDTEYNESVDITFTLAGKSDNDDIMPMELYRDLCIRFAKAMGYAEKTVDEYFGKW